MDKLPLNMLPAAVVILTSILSMFLGVVTYLLKDIRSDSKLKQKEQDIEIEKIKEDFSDFKEVLPQKYVLRDDFLRAIANLDNKVDKVGNEIAEMNKNISKMLGVNKVE